MGTPKNNTSAVAEAIGKLRPVLHRLELRFGERVVVRDVGTAVRFDNTKIGEQQRHRLRGHRGAAIGMNGELSRYDALARTGVADQLVGQRRTLAVCHHPAHHVAAEVVHEVS
jgi:hypothetical protein